MEHNQEPAMQIEHSQPQMAAEQVVTTQEAPISRWHNDFKATENIILNDFKNIEQLVNQGRLSLRDGADLKSYVLQKAFESSSKSQAKQPLATGKESSEVLTAFESEFPGFFELEGRNGVKEYIMKTFSTVGIEQIAGIAGLVEELERKAIERYKSGLSEPQRLKQHNEQAKTRLSTLSASASGANTAVKKTFTRAEISKMDSATFLANEKEIMAQMQRGDLK